MKQSPVAARTVRSSDQAERSSFLKSLLSRGAVDWNMSERTALYVVLVPIVVCFSGAATALLGKGAYKWFVTEDGFAENLQVLFWTLSFVFCLFVAKRAWRNNDRLVAVLYIILTFGLFFLIGEELSWGQRMFGWETPASMGEINKQNETNLHNIYGVGDTFKWITLMIGVYGTLLPLLLFFTSVFGSARATMAWITPHFLQLTYFAPFFVWRVYRNLFDPPKGIYFVVSEYSEVMELNLAIGFFLFMLYQLRRNLNG